MICNGKPSVSVLYKGGKEKATVPGLVNKNAFRYNIRCRKLCRKGEDEELDRWNRKDQNTYTGINVQRRNRRKPDMGMPVESEETAVSETADGLEQLL